MSSNGPFREVQASCLAPPVPSSGPADHGTQGPAKLSHCWQPCVQAGLHSGAWVRLGELMLPADFIPMACCCHGGGVTPFVALAFV